MQDAVRSVHANVKDASHKLIRYPARLAVPLVLGDAVMLAVAASLCAVLLVYVAHRDIEPIATIMSAVASGALWMAIFAYVGFYRRSFAISWHDEYYWVASVSTIAIIPQLVLYTLLPAISTSRLLLLLTIPMNAVVIGTFRAMLRRWWDYKGQLGARIAFVGAPHDVRGAENRFNLPRNASTFLIPVPGWPEEPSALNGPPREQYDRWLSSARSWGADRVVFMRAPARNAIKELTAASARHRMPLAFASRRTPPGGGDFELDRLGPEPILVPRLPRACSASAGLLKTAIDFGFALIGLAIFFPVMIAAAATIYLESGAPVLFRQERIGQNGAVFHILKFRSMRHDAEQKTGATWATANDSRVTPVGRFLRRTSLDELPQIFNVLKGEMSIVGPRPERAVFAERFRETLDGYDGRYLVRPGITGLSHVYMHRDVDESAVGERLDYDLFYIEHWSPMMDLSIILKTGCEFLLHRIAA